MQIRDYRLQSNVLVKMGSSLSHFQRVRDGKFVKSAQFTAIGEWIAYVGSSKINIQSDYDIILMDEYTISTDENEQKQRWNVSENLEAVKVSIEDFFVKSFVTIEISKFPLTKILEDVVSATPACRNIYFGMPGEHSRFGVVIDVHKWLSSKDIAKSVYVGLSIELPVFINQLNSNTQSIYTSSRVADLDSDINKKRLTQRLSVGSRDMVYDDQVTTASNSENSSTVEGNILILLDESRATAFGAKKLIDGFSQSAYIIEVGLFRSILESEFHKMCNVDMVIDLVSEKISRAELQRIEKEIHFALEEKNRDVFVLFGSEIAREVNDANFADSLHQFYPDKELNVVVKCKSRLAERVNSLKKLFGPERLMHIHLVNSDIQKIDNVDFSGDKCVYRNIEVL